MKKFLLGLGVVLLGACVYVSQPWVNAATDGVTIFENENYSGYSAVLTVGEYPLTALKALGVKNNDISSIRVPAGYKAELFDRDKIKGDPFVFTTDDPSFKDNGCDNMISAVRVTYSGSQPTQVNPSPSQVNPSPSQVQPSPSQGPIPSVAPGQLIGFASLNGGTTGGKGGPTVTVRTAAELQSAVNLGGPRIIMVANKISGSTKISIKNVSNLSIIGVGTSGELEGIGLSMRYVSNIIIQNLKIHHVKASDDCIGIEGPANNIWVDHCELYNDLNHDKDYYDGLLDSKSSAQYITVSWTYFHDSYKTSLNGSSDSDNYDRKVTYHHNYFKNCNSRLPLYRFGTGHVFNNYYSDVPTSGVNSRMGAKLRVEGNYFERVNNPICSLDSDEVGYWDVKNNTFVDCTGNQPTTSNCSFTPPYSYTLESPETAKAKILAGVGVGKI